MPTTALKHVRQNIVAYIALFVALGGTSAAAINAMVLKNHSITPVKFDRRFINGSIRAWAVVAPNGTVQAGAGKPTVQVASFQPGSYVIKWMVSAPTQRGCFALAGLQASLSGGGSAQAGVFVRSKRRWVVDVDTFGAQGQPLAQGFSVALVC